MNWFRRLFGRGSDDDSASKDAPRPSRPIAPPPSVEQQIATLDQCGIRLREGITIEHLLESSERDEFAKPPYLMAVVALGGDLEEAEGGRVSDNVWHFDTECIEDHGDYVRIAERIRDLAGGDLPITNMSDEIDIENDVARLEFDLDGRHHSWKLKVDNDWVDDGLFPKFDELLAGRKSRKRLTYLDLGGQDCMIGCMTPPELARLKQMTGLRFKWMGGST